MANDMLVKLYDIDEFQHYDHIKSLAQDGTKLSEHNQLIKRLFWNLPKEII